MPLQIFPEGASFFCLDAKEPKNQGCVCFATRSLHFAVRIATRALRSNSDALGRSVPVVRLTLTSRGRSYPLAFGIGELFLSPEDSSPVLRGAGSRSETEGVRCLPHHNIFCVYLRRKILRLYNHPAQELIVRIFNPVIRCYNPSPLRGAPLQQGSFFKSRGYLPRHNISCVHLRRKILRLYNYPAQEMFPLFNRICNPIVLSIRIFNPIIRCYNPSPPSGSSPTTGELF